MTHINISEAIGDIRSQYNPNELDIMKDAVSIPRILITYDLDEALTISNDKPNTPGIQCHCKCSVCTEYTKNNSNELIRYGRYGMP